MKNIESSVSFIEYLKYHLFYVKHHFSNLFITNSKDAHDQMGKKNVIYFPNGELITIWSKLVEPIKIYKKWPTL